MTNHPAPTPAPRRPDPSPRPDPSARRTALVLGGGGSAGNAWLIGVVAGLAQAGIDVARADLVVGTSAGSTAAAQICGGEIEQLYAGTVRPIPGRTGGAPRSGSRAATESHLDRIDAIIAAATDPPDLRRRLGASAFELAARDDISERWRATVAGRLPSTRWPEQRVVITAVDAATGEPMLFDRDSGVDLVDAVAASCSSGPAYRVGDRSYIDGGYRRGAENADLALGHDHVLVLAPFGGRTRTPESWGMHLEAQVAELRASGSRVEVLAPEEDIAPLFGVNAMDPASRAPAARGGLAQGARLAEQIVDVWG